MCGILYIRIKSHNRINMHGIYFMDMQWLNGVGDTEMIKEIAVVSQLYYENCFHEIVKCASDAKSMRLSDRARCNNSWIVNNYHGLGWSDGTVSYTRMLVELRKYFADSFKFTVYVFVKGAQKQKIANKLFKRIGLGRRILVRDMENANCKIAFSRHHHHHHDGVVCRLNVKNPRHKVCAFRNATMLKKWFIDKQQQQQNV